MNLSHSAYTFDYIERPKMKGSTETIAAFRGGATCRVSSHSSEWMKALKLRFDRITALPIGWDGYAGRPVSFSCAAFAANILERLCHEFPDLPPPGVVPGSDGTVQLEWHAGGFDIELDVLGVNSVAAERYVHETREIEEIEIRTDFSRVVQWLEELSQRRREMQNQAA